ncbi:hypothetical protein G6F60_006608 [Rhizopus arrhizus]|nr:hypothetical protein G6F61_008027 [Rhizopus arrhizus]KAG1401119.1 hypothetical protein G6F60_006608 [Rhizopus arrhizus]
MSKKSQKSVQTAATTTSNTTHGHHTGGASNTTLNPSVPTLTPAQMYSNFEEWIKMCTDNKVNATNTWNFALIDYFHEMTFLREGDSINFQKASCTLDGCVKIYTSRVDSVATETGKLLSGLADSAHGNEDEETRKERRVRRKTQRADASLVKDFSTISLKKFDLDFAVDPLFKKTSADFDEGGARGLLLNHLSIDRHCKIIFDASDSTIERDEPNPQEDPMEIETDEKIQDEEEEEGEEMDVDQTAEQVNTSKESQADDAEEEEDKANERDKINDEEDKPVEDAEDKPVEDAEDNPVEDAEDKPVEDAEDNPVEDAEEGQAEEGQAEEAKGEKGVEMFDKSNMIEISRLKSKLPDLQSLEELSIVPSLKGFDFFSDTLEIPELHSEEEDHPEEIAGDEANFMPDYNDDYDIDYGHDDLEDPFTFDDTQNDQAQEDEEGLDGLDDGEGGLPEKDYLTALLNNENKDLFHYFDNTLIKNWAGPEHWKLRRPPPTTTTQTINKEMINNEEKTTKKKTRQDYFIEFKEEGEDEDAIFEASTKKLTLPNNPNPSKHLLPDDIHFSSKQLLQYFLKPMFPIEKKKKEVKRDEEKREEEGDVNFWAEQTQDYVDYDLEDGQSLPVDMTDNNEPTLLSTMDDSGYYQDNYDDIETSGIYGDTLITGHQLKRTRPLYVNYARTAKRVDVKKLKDNLWKALTKDEQVNGIQKFTDIVSNLKKMYPPKVMKDISVPFCFICLLHLANERDLVIKGSKGDEDEDDFVMGDNDWMNNESVLNEITIYQNITSE